MGRPKKPAGTRTRDGKVSFVLFIDPDDHQWLKDEAKALGIPLYELILNRATGRPLPVHCPKPDFSKSGMAASLPASKAGMTEDQVRQQEADLLKLYLVLKAKEAAKKKQRKGP
jgi:hypothetical protein